VIAILLKLALGHESSLRGHSKATWAAFVINLERRPDRLASFSNTLREQQPWILQKLHNVTGVDGRMLRGNATFQEKLVQTGRISREHLEGALSGGNLWPALTPGAVGLFLSHAEVWKQIAESNLDYGVVFEDDLAYFTADFEDKVRSGILENASFQDDFVYLQECSKASAWPRSGSLEASYTVLEAEQVVPCTAAYIVSKKAAGLLLTNAFPMSTQLDHALSGAVVSGLRRASYIPSLAQVGNHSLVSDVQLPPSAILLGLMGTSSRALSGTTYTTTYLGSSGASTCRGTSLGATTPRQQQCVQNKFPGMGSASLVWAMMQAAGRGAGEKCSEKDAHITPGGAYQWYHGDLSDISCSCAGALLDQLEGVIKDCYLSIPLSCICEVRDSIVDRGARDVGCPTMKTC